MDYKEMYLKMMRASEDAIKTLNQLSSNRYQSRDKNFSFLLHSTGHHPAGTEIDTSIIYADYYYLEALLKLRRNRQTLWSVHSR